MGQIHERVSHLSGDKQALLRRLLRAGEQAGGEHGPLRHEGVSEFPLSRAQESMWFLSHLAPDGGVYNLPAGVRLRGPLNASALSASFNEIIRRHEILRTSFHLVAGKPVQRVQPPMELDLPIRAVPPGSGEERQAWVRSRAAEEAARPIDLGKAPLFRGTLFHLGPDDHVLLLVFHHLIWDGWSIGLFTAELAALYGAFKEGRPSPLPEPAHQYGDWVLWETEHLDEELLAEREAFWREHVGGCEDPDLPLDRPRGEVQSFAGSMHFFEIPEDLSAELDGLCRRASATMFQVLLAGFGLLLRRWSGTEKFCLGTPIANRLRAEFEPVIGYFANVLVLPVDASGRPGFRDLVRRVAKAATAAYANQDIPFETLVDRLGVERDASRNPLFQVMFALHAESLDAVALADLEQEPFQLGSDTTHFDLGLHLWRRDGGLSGYFSYNSDIFDAATVARMAVQLCTLLRAACERPDAPAAELPLLSAAEVAWLEGLGPESERSLPAGHVLDGLLERARAPETASAPVLGPVEAGTGEGRTVAELATAAAGSRDLVDELPAGTVGVVVDSGDEWAALLLGALAAGRSVAPLPVDADPEELRWWMEQGGVVGLLGGPDAPAESAGAQTQRRSWAQLLERGSATTVRPPAPGAALLGMLEGSALRRAGDDLRFHVTTMRAAAGAGGLAAALPHRAELLIPALLAAVELGVPLLRVDSEAALADLPEGAALVTTPAILARLASGDAVAPLRKLHRIVLCGADAAALRNPPLVAGFLGEMLGIVAPPEIPRPLGLSRLGSGATPPRIRPELGDVRVVESTGSRCPVGVRGALEVAGVRTPEQVRRLADGALELCGTVDRSLMTDGRRRSAGSIEAALTGLPEVAAARLVRAAGAERFAAVVPARDPAELERPRVRDAMRRAAPGLSFAVVSRLPLAPDGGVDDRALAAPARWDDQVDERAGALVRSLPGVRDAAATRRPRSFDPGAVHMDVLLPDRGSRPVAERTSTVDSARGGVVESDDGPLAYASGGPLELPEDAPRTLTEALRRIAEGPWGEERGITIYERGDDPEVLSYRELLDEAVRLLAGLQRAGLEPGGRVILQAATLRDHFISFWACVLGGITPVTVAGAPSYDRPNAVLNKLRNIWKLLGRPPLITAEELRRPLAGAGELYDREEDQAGPFRLLTVEELRSGAEPEDARIRDAEPDDLVFFQLTSGSTGVPKCIQETHDGIVHHIHGSAAANGYTSDDVTVNWLPMDHVVPILTCHLKDTYMGLRQVHVRTDRVLADPLLWLDLMERHRATHSWAPNFGFKLVNDALAERGTGRSWDLSPVRFFMNAGEQVTLSVTEEFVRRLRPFGLRDEAMQPAFGMAEVCTCMTYANDFTAGTCGVTVLKSTLSGKLERVENGDEPGIHFIDLGPPMPGIEIRIADERGNTLPEMVIGRFQIRGPTTTPGYLDNPEANAEAFVGEGWFNSGDLGFIRNGRLSLTGREKEMIIVRGANFYCYEIEDVINNTPGVLTTFSAACAVDDPTTGTEGLAVFFVPEGAAAGAELIDRVRENVTREFGVAPGIVLPLGRDEFPKTTSGKIQRTRLKKKLAAGGFDDRLRALDLAAGRNVLPAWFHRRVWRARRAEPAGCELGPARVVRWDPERSFGEQAHALIRTAAELCDSGPARLLILSEGAVELRSGDSPRPESGALEGLVRSLLQEFPELRARVVDLDGGGAAAEQVIEAELACGDEEPLAAWRDGARWVPRYSAIRFQGERRAPPMSVGGLWVISGGLGGIGAELADYLMDRYDLSLLLLGRTPLDGEPEAIGAETVDQSEEGETGSGLAATRGVTERRADLERLRAAGRVWYRVVDVTDAEAVARAIRAAEAEAGEPVRGAFHLAGGFPARLLREEDAAGLDGVLAPKIDGFSSLDSALPDDAPIVAFGSVYAGFGGLASGAYSAANSALAASCAARRSRGARDTWCVAFSNWRDTGLSAGYDFESQSEALGWRMLRPRDALRSLDAVLRLDDRDPIVGLDETRANVRWRTDGPAEPWNRGVVWYASEPDQRVDLSGLRIPDLRGRLLQPELVRVDEIPRDSKGKPDLSRLAGQAARVVEAVLPRTDMEKQVAAVWRDVLGLDEVDIDSTFFALGGQSVQLVQVVARLSQTLGRDLSVVELFRRPTVRALSAWLEGARGKKRADFDKAAARAEKQRGAMKRRQRPAGRGRRRR